MRFPVVSHIEHCPDTGLLAIDTPALVLITWIGIMIAAEQALHAISLFFRHWRSLSISPRLNPLYELPSLLAIGWVVFTSLSIITIGIMWRGSPSIFMKGVHIVFEGSFLVSILLSCKLYTPSALVTAMMITAFSFVVTLPCDQSLPFAAILGIVLDSSNFLLHVGIFISQRNNKQVMFPTAAFGFHIVYLITRIMVNEIQMINTLQAILRISGVFCNIAANELLIRGVQYFHCVRTSKITVCGCNWLSEHKKTNCLHVVWTVDGLRLIGKIPNESVILEGHTHGDVAYEEKTWWRFLVPWGSRILLLPDCICNHTVHVSFSCGPFFIYKHALTKAQLMYHPCGQVTVYSWNTIRLFYCACFILLGLLFFLI